MGLPALKNHCSWGCLCCRQRVSLALPVQGRVREGQEGTLPPLCGLSSAQTSVVLVSLSKQTFWSPCAPSIPGQVCFQGSQCSQPPDSDLQGSALAREMETPFLDLVTRAPRCQTGSWHTIRRNGFIYRWQCSLRKDVANGGGMCLEEPGGESQQHDLQLDVSATNLLKD